MPETKQIRIIYPVEPIAANARVSVTRMQQITEVQYCRRRNTCATIRRLNKAKYLVNCARKLVTDFNGVVPQTLKELTSLPGVGRKVADVVLAECFTIPAFPVDTHVSRVARRLAMVPPKASLLAIEKKLMAAVPEDKWLDAHHSMIFWGRYRCMARNPRCSDCPLLPMCITGQQNVL